MSSIMRKTVDIVNKQGNAPDEDVLEAIHGLKHLFRTQQYRAVRDTAGLAHMEGKVLGFFARHPGETQSALVAHSGRDKGQVARLVAGLRERGLLEARADEADRRTTRLHLTAEGAALQQALRRQARRLSAAALADFSETERRQLQAYLARMRANLEAGES